MTGDARQGAARPRVQVHLDHGRGLEAWTRRFERGEVWEASPYGYGRAADAVDLAFSEDHPETRVGRFLRRGTAHLLGFDIVHAWRNRRQLAEADVVWTHTEHEHLAVRAVERLRGTDPRPLVAQSVWLWDRWDAYSPLRRSLYRRLLSGDTLHTTLSRENADIARAAIPGAQVALVPFGAEDIAADVTDDIAAGVAADRAAGSSPETAPDGSSIAMVAPGNDRDRDWSTLLAAVAEDPSISATILTRRLAASSTPRLTIRRSRSIAETLDAYRRASVIVVPVRPNHHASGITVGLEAMSLRRPLVIADVGGVRDYFDGYAEFYDAGDAASLRRAIHRAAGRDLSDAPSKASRGLTAADYVARHLLATDLLRGGSASVEQLESFSPLVEHRGVE